jgi:hypothetical protein
MKKPALTFLSVTLVLMALTLTQFVHRPPAIAEPLVSSVEDWPPETQASVDLKMLRTLSPADQVKARWRYQALAQESEILDCLKEVFFQTWGTRLVRNRMQSSVETLRRSLSAEASNQPFLQDVLNQLLEIQHDLESLQIEQIRTQNALQALLPSAPTVVEQKVSRELRAKHSSELYRMTSASSETPAQKQIR